MAKSALIKKQIAAARRQGISEDELTLTMAATREPESPLATRVPNSLRHRMRVHCITNQITMQDFIVSTLTEALDSRKGK
jgi:hypothetical protein